MKALKKLLSEIFIDGLSGMALGLFSTLIIGTIITQIASFTGGAVGTFLSVAATVAKTLTGAGIGVGVAVKLKQSPLVTASAAIAGMTGAFPAVGSGLTEFVLGSPGEPLGAFVGAIVAIEIGKLISGKTPIDIILTPFVCIVTGCAAGLVAGPPISAFMLWLGELVNFNVDAHPIIGGVIVSVLMGMILTLPISSAAIGISMGLSGLAAGAATIGCCCNMVGFAVASFRENKTGGLIAQGIGTSMLQVPNIVRKPIIWLPAIVSSALLGPVSSFLLHMKSNAIGSGMGTSGLVGPIASFQTMAPEIGAVKTLVEILFMEFILPAIITLAISELMRKKGLIKSGDMKIDAG